MKFKIIFRMVLICFLALILSRTMATSVLAADESSDNKDIQQILQKLDELNKRLEVLENEKEEPTDTEDIRKDVEDLEKDVTEMSDHLYETATRTLVDKISLGAELRTRCDWYKFEDHDYNLTDSVDALFSNRFRLNLRSEIIDGLRFHGRLTVYKNWMIIRNPSGSDVNDLYETRIPTDADVKLERAYVDYFFKRLPLALTFGRLPVTDGLPTDLRDDTPRKSTYPSLAYDVTGDGIALTVYLDSVIPLPKPNWKFIYSRLGIIDETYLYRDDAAEVDDLSILVTQFETGGPGIFKDTLFIANLIYLDDYPAPDLKYMGVYDVSIPESFASIYKWTLFAESKNFLDSGIDWFAGYCWEKFDVSGEPAIYDKIPMIGVLSYDNREDQDAYAYYLGVRAKIPFKLLKEPMIGLEYNYGSKNWFGFTMGSEDPLDKLDTRGSVWDIYYIQPFNQNFMLRAGYTLVDYDYDKSGNPVGPPQEIDREISNIYFLLDARF